MTRKLEWWEEEKITLCITTPTFLGYFYIYLWVSMCGSLSEKEVGGVGGGEGDTVHHKSPISRTFLYTCGCPCVFPTVTRKLEGWKEGR